MRQKPFDWLAWPSSPEKGHRVFPHKLRDGAALAEIQALLVKCGYEYRDTWLNFPNGPNPSLPSDGLVVQATRTPVPVKEAGGAKKVVRVLMVFTKISV